MRLVDPASALAELMNQRLRDRAAARSAAARQTGETKATNPTATAELYQSGSNQTEHIERIAVLVCELLGARLKPQLTRKLRSWPQVLEDADDLGQLAALAFVDAYRLGRIQPDPVTAQYTASSVLAYLWGVCNRIFLGTLRRSRRSNLQLDASLGEPAFMTQESSPLQWMLPEGQAEDDESRLWAVLETVRDRCRPQDLVVTYLLGCGFSSGEIRQLLRISINMPSKGIKRVGQAVRELLGLDQAARRVQTPGHTRGKQDPGSGHSPGSSKLPALELIRRKWFDELLDLLASPSARGMFLREAVAALGPAPSISVEQSLADRQYSIRAEGDWSWGLLSAQERRKLLLRDARLLLGAGFPDEGAAQRAALEKLVADLGNIYEELERALMRDDLDWLLPLAENLHILLGIVSEFREMRQRYSALLEAARRLNSPRLELLAQLGLGNALKRLGENAEAQESLERAAGLARELNDPRTEALALFSLADLAWLTGDYPRSSDLHRHCLSICRDIGYRHGEAQAIAGLAVIHHTLGEYDTSERLHIQALNIRREIGDRQGESYSLGNLAVVHGSMGNDVQSAELYGQCMMLCRQLGDRRGEARSMNGLAILHSSHGEYGAAVEKFSRVIEICREIGDREGESYAQVCWAGMCGERGEYERAAELYRQALEITTASANRSDEATILCGLATIHTILDELDIARELHRQGLSIYIEIGHNLQICKECAFAAPCLAASGALRQAAIAHYGAMHQAALLSITFDQKEQESTGRTLSSLAHAADSGEISESELDAWRREGETLDLDGLAQYVLAALEQLEV